MKNTRATHTNTPGSVRRLGAKLAHWLFEPAWQDRLNRYLAARYERAVLRSEDAHMLAGAQPTRRPARGRTGGSPRRASRPNRSATG